MPEANAQQTPVPVSPDLAQIEPKGQITHLEQYQQAKLNKIAQHTGKATGLKVSSQSLQPPIELPIPIHVSQGQAVQKRNQIPLVPGSHEEAKTPLTDFARSVSETGDFVDQIVTGRSHVIDEAHKFIRKKDEMKDRKQEFLNAMPKKPLVRKIKDWFYKENKTQERDRVGLIHAEDRFIKQRRAA